MASTRAQRLARRVGWLDRYRRWLAVGVTIAIAPFVCTRLMEGYASNYGVLLGVVVLCGAWAIVETVLAWVTAMWETEHVALSRDLGLPVAIVRKRKRRP